MKIKIIKWLFKKVGLLISKIFLLIGISFFSLFAGAEKKTCTVLTPIGLKSIETCAEKSIEGRLSIHSEVLKSASYDKYGLAGLNWQDQCYWFSRRGKYLQTPCVDQRPDAFSARLARYIDENGKYGYMNWSLMPALTAKWDYALPFQTTFAKVCSGCQLKAGEASGGSWFVINLKGRVVKECLKATKASECEP